MTSPDLRVQVRFVAVTVVADRGERLAAAHGVSHVDRDAALLEVAPYAA